MGWAVDDPVDDELGTVSGKEAASSATKLIPDEAEMLRCSCSASVRLGTRL